MASSGNPKVAAILRDFESALEDLTFNSKPLINDLTMAAEKYKPIASSIVKKIEQRVLEVASFYCSNFSLLFLLYRVVTFLCIVCPFVLLCSVPILLFWGETSTCWKHGFINLRLLKQDMIGCAVFSLHNSLVRWQTASDCELMLCVYELLKRNKNIVNSLWLTGLVGYDFSLLSFSSGSSQPYVAFVIPNGFHYEEHRWRVCGPFQSKHCTAVLQIVWETGMFIHVINWEYYMQSWIMYLCTVLETQVVENVTMAIG